MFDHMGGSVYSNRVIYTTFKSGHVLVYEYIPYSRNFSNSRLFQLFVRRQKFGSSLTVEYVTRCHFTYIRSRSRILHMCVERCLLCTPHLCCIMPHQVYVYTMGYIFAPSRKGEKETVKFSRCTVQPEKAHCFFTLSCCTIQRNFFFLSV